MKEKYSLLDSGDQQKLERFGDYLIARPCSQALWRPSLSQDQLGSGRCAIFSRWRKCLEFEKKTP